MFYCNFCGRAFTRKFNLARHSAAKHTTSNNGAKHVNNTDYSNTSNNNDDDNHSLSDIVYKNNGSDDNGRNGERNGHNNNKSPPLEINNFIQKFPDKKDCFDERILATTEAIKSKFNALRESKNAVQKEQEDTHIKLTPENNATLFGSKLLELLQRALDIIMIKELQNVDITDKNEENLNGEGGGQSHNTIGKEENEDKINFPETIPCKRLKYDNLSEFENDYDHSSIDSECVERKYWHNANTLVDELRNLMITTELGRQIFTIMKSLKEINDMQYNNHYTTTHNKERDELIQNLNELKKTDIGQQILCILHELEKAEIIERGGNYTTDINH